MSEVGHAFSPRCSPEILSRMTAKSKISPNSSKTGLKSSSSMCFGIWPTKSLMASES